ncbi:exported hypothetical protein [Xenorhabdus nematophila str. Anatoliense]|nr:exported hypothetical protein [Xenorhabdus nematophila str. Anatoliense]
MERKYLIALLSLGIICGLTACGSFSSRAPSVSFQPIMYSNAPLTDEKWNFRFTTPRYSPIYVSSVHFLNENNSVIRTFMPVQPHSDQDTLRVNNAVNNNQHEVLPYGLVVCWNPIVKKQTTQTIQTNFIVRQQTHQGTHKPIKYSNDEKELFYYKNLFNIKLSSWENLLMEFYSFDKNNGNIMLLASGKGESVSGDNMTICRDKTNHPDG